MNEENKGFQFTNAYIYFGIVILFTAGAIYLINNQYLKFDGELVFLREMTEKIQTSHIELVKERDLLEREKNDLKSNLEKLIAENNDLNNELGRATEKAEDFEKLFETDKELLQKYSKVFFLNEHYEPSKLTKIDSKYLYYPDRETQIHRQVWPHLEKMLEDAEDDGINLRIVSGYRSFENQKTLKSGYSVVYGSGANAFSADQGYSEHQLGTTVDIVSVEYPYMNTSFENTDAYKWLQENGYKYGFALSYPKGNSYYTYEPWHWRFVSEDLARRLHRKNQNFYDWDQRDIDQYLLNFFD